MTAPAPTRAKVLVVDDNEVDREHVKRLLASTFSIAEASTAREALGACAGADCVLLDNRLPDADGLELLPELLRRQLPVLMLTGQGSESIAVEAMKRGAYDYLTKESLAREALTRAIANALETNTLRRRVDDQQQQLRVHLAELARKTEALELSNKALADRDAQLRLVLEQMPAILWSGDADLRYTSISGAGLRAIGFGSADLVGRAIGELGGHEVDVHVAAQRRALGGEFTRYDFTLRGRTFEGHVEPLRGADGVPCGVVGVALDVTDAKRLERELRQSQKMEAVGQLAGGIAHDFNNILTVIKSFGGFVLEEIPPESPLRADVGEILGAADRAVTLVRQLLAFAKRQPVAPRIVDAGAITRAMIPMLRRLVGEDIEVRLVTDPELWPTCIDPGALEQVIVNLVVNARDAMPNGGSVTIELSNVAFDEHVDVGRGRFVPPGEYVGIAVTDEGTGIPESIRDRIFEPFFTTKEMGRGTGLGLSTCYGIVQQAGGVLIVYSEEGVGSTFRAHLRRSTTDAESATSAARVAPKGGTETILVVEDESPVRALILRSLSGYGYRVLEAPDATSAARIVEEHGGPIDLVLTDVVMPKLRGPEVVRRLRVLLPDVKVLYMSGYSGDALRHRELVEGRAPMLEKPFTKEGLAHAVRAVLDART